MSAPGVTVTVSTAPAPNSVPASTGTFFVVGASERGPVGSPVLIQSMADFATKLGSRVSYSVAYDVADVFFREGGNTLWFSRAVGPSATTAAHTFVDRAGSPLNTIVVSAKGAGVAGNTISVAVVAGSVTNTFVLQVFLNGVLVETSTLCGTPADAVAWSSKSNYVTVTNSNSATAAPNNNPAVIAAQALTGGTDDNASISNTQNIAALAAFTADKGPGQVSVSGNTVAAVHQAVIAHAIVNNRVPLNDMPDTATAATITTQVGTEQAAVTDPSYAAPLAPWVVYPPVPTGTAVVPPNRFVPPSALVAGLMARNDGVNTANKAAAGPNGVARAAIDVSQTYSDTDRDLLNQAGVNVIRNISDQGGVQLYGYRSMALDPNWTDLASVRMRMQLVAEAVKIGASFNFGQIDGQGKLLAAFNGALVAMLTGYWAKGALYGASPGDAFSVNTGPTVNTQTTIANRELHAVMSVKMSPSAEQVIETIVRFPLTSTVAA